MIEAYSQSLSVGTGDTIVFSSTANRTNGNIVHSNGVFTVNTVGRYKVTFNGIFTATTAGVAGVQLYTNGNPLARGQTQATVVADTVYGFTFSTVVKVLPAPTGESAELTLKNTLTGTWNLADVIVERLP